MRQRKEGRERRLGEEVDELEEVVVVGTQIAVLQTVQDGRVLSCSLLPAAGAARPGGGEGVRRVPSRQIGYRRQRWGRQLGEGS